MADPLFINASAGAPAYSANELRQAMALALMYDGRNMGARKGVRPGGNQLQVSYAAPTITVQPGLCYLDPALSTPQGGYWVAIPAAETFTLTAADATNPRKDIIVARVYDHDEDASGLRLARTEYLVGTPNPSPSEPAVPAGAIKLALLDVPASPGAVVVTDRRPWTVAAGGILPVAAAGDIAAGVAGRYRHRLDTAQLEMDNGAAWLPLLPVTRRKTSDTANNTTTFLGDPSLTLPVPAIGNYKLTGILWYSTPVAADLKMRFTYSGAGGFTGGNLLRWSDSGPSLFDSTKPNLALTFEDNQQTFGGTGGFAPVAIDGTLVVVNLGNLTLEWAQNTANAGPTLVIGNSWLCLEYIP